MIPKKIHYIWLSDEKPGRIARRCISSWKRFAPDYEIRRWTLSDFDLDSLPEYVSQALSAKKWAFACDYLRLYVLEREGGIYLDSDVLMLRSPDSFLEHRFVSSIEYFPKLFEIGKHDVDENGCGKKPMVTGLAIQAAILFSEPGHPFLKACMEHYKNMNFTESSLGSSDFMLAPHTLAYCAVPFGFKYKDEQQVLLEDMVLCPSSVFAPGIAESVPSSDMIHLCLGSWRKMPRYRKLAYNLRLERDLLRVSGGHCTKQ